MAQETDLAAFLAELEAERAEIEATIAVVRRRMAARGIEPSTPAGHSPDIVPRVAVPLAPGVVLTPQAIPPGTFHGLSVSEAASAFGSDGFRFLLLERFCMPPRYWRSRRAATAPRFKLTHYPRLTLPIIPIVRFLLT